VKKAAQYGRIPFGLALATFVLPFMETCEFSLKGSSEPSTQVTGVALLAGADASGFAIDPDPWVILAFAALLAGLAYTFAKLPWALRAPAAAAGVATLGLLVFLFTFPDRGGDWIPSLGLLLALLFSFGAGVTFLVFVIVEARERHAAERAAPP